VCSSEVSTGTGAFNIFFSSREGGIERTLNKFANDTVLCGMVDVLEERVAI